MLDNNTTNKDAMFPVTEDGYSTIETENAPSAPFTSPPPSFPSASQIHDLPQFNAEAQSLDYLLNDQKYIEQKKLYLQETEVETLSKMLTQLHAKSLFTHHSREVDEMAMQIARNARAALDVPDLAAAASEGHAAPCQRTELQPHAIRGLTVAAKPRRERLDIRLTAHSLPPLPASSHAMRPSSC